MVSQSIKLRSFMKNIYTHNFSNRYFSTVVFSFKILLTVGVFKLETSHLSSLQSDFHKIW